MIRLAAAGLFALPAIAIAEPRLVSSSPADGAVDVPSGEQTLVFRFSEPLAPDRMSVTTNASGAAPEFIGRPNFSADGRTFTIRMRLRPGVAYAVGANSSTYRNFQTPAGVPVAPVLVRFRTAT